jgi:cell division protein FtsQ
VRTLEIRGGSPAVRADVRTALAPEVGRSLVTVHGSEIAQRLSAIPGLASFSVDRSFPHTLRLTIRAERAVLVLRAGSKAYLVASDGRVLRSLAHPRMSSLPRAWLPAATAIGVGQSLPRAEGGDAAAAAAAVRGGLGAPLRTVTTHDGNITFILGTGFELRLGDAGDLRLKLAIARRIIDASAAAKGGNGYLDVSVPERPVLNVNPQVGG